MYAAQVNDKLHTFNTSGSLWRDAMVMIDMETRTLWSQVDGLAIKGELKGSELTLVPFKHTNFAEFRAQHPNGKLLKKPGKGDHASSYDSYSADPGKLGIFGRADNFTRLPAKDIVFGLRSGNRQVAVSQKRLARDGFVVIDEFDPPIVVIRGNLGSTAAAYTLADLSRESKPVVTVTDGQIFVNGEAAKNTAPHPVLSSYWFAWASFFPETELID